MLFKDYLEKCLEDENFREEWNKQHEEEKRIHIELMNKFIEIAENNIIPKVINLITAKAPTWESLSISRRFSLSPQEASASLVSI